MLIAPPVAIDLKCVTTKVHDTSDQLVESHLGFARALARRLSRTLVSHADQEALESDAMLGLLLAARCFDRDRGAAFATYAARRIWGAMIDGLRQRHGCGRNHRPPAMHSLSAPLFATDGREVSLADLLGASEDAVGMDLEHKDQCDHLLRHVTAASRCMVREHYLEGLSQHEIGRRHGLSASRVCQRIKAARQRMREIACAN